MTLRILDNLEQGTEAWFDQRRGMVTVTISLTRGQVTLIDAADEERVRSASSWHALYDRGNFYAAHKKGRGLERLHNFLTGWPLVDHINRDGLDNRRANLRPATLAENARNRGLNSNSTSGFKGVSWHRVQRKWAAYITADGRRHSLGYHATPEAAALAYDAAARELHKEFAFLNFPEVTG